MSTFDKTYVQWAQRTLNREVDAELVTNGVKSSHYRDAIEAFQRWQSLSVTHDIGRPEQDKMIRINQSSTTYVEWIQRALRHVEPSLPNTGRLDTTTKGVLRSFQSYHDLRADAVVGPRTEMTLVDTTGLLPFGHITGGGPKPKPPKTRPAKPKTDPFRLPTNHVVTHIISSNYYHALHNRSSYATGQRKKLLCVLGKMKRRHGINDRYPMGGWIFNANHGSTKYTTVDSFFQSAREYLSNRVAHWPAAQRADSVAGRVLVSDMIKQIESGLHSVRRHEKGLYTSSETEQFKRLLPGLVEKVKVRRKSPSSILSCFK